MRVDKWPRLLAVRTGAGNSSGSAWITITVAEDFAQQAWRQIPVRNWAITRGGSIEQCVPAPEVEAVWGVCKHRVWQQCAMRASTRGCSVAQCASTRHGGTVQYAIVIQ
eukprot:1161423-Pelagomonas_calceolata.AAC.1